MGKSSNLRSSKESASSARVNPEAPIPDAEEDGIGDDDDSRRSKLDRLLLLFTPDPRML